MNKAQLQYKHVHETTEMISLHCYHHNSIAEHVASVCESIARRIQLFRDAAYHRATTECSV